MKTPRYTRKFDYKAALRGAPVGLECGQPVEIWKWNLSMGYPIIGCHGEKDQIARWDLDGSHSSMQTPQLALVMLPLGILDGLPVFDGDTILCDEGRETLACPGMSFHSACSWRWPAYPTCQMSGEQLEAIAAHAPDAFLPERLRFVADAVLRDAVQRGQVRMAEEIT